MPNKQTPSGTAPALLPVPAFDPDLLPDALRPWIADIAARMQCPPDFPAVAAMAALAGVVGRQVAIRPKRRDDWTVIPNLWGGMVARPGLLKTPAMREAMKPLKRLEIRAAAEHAEAVREYAARAMVGAARKKVAEEAIRKAVKSGGDNPDTLAADSVAESEPEPTRRRFIANDPTPEKLAVLMSENQNGLLLERDELTGFLRGLDKPGREDARAFYLESWAGDGRFTVDRIGRGTLDVAACCVSIIGTVQPGPLQSYLFQLTAGGAGDDGLLPRFQLLVWPDVAPEWHNVDSWPDKTAKRRAYDVFDRLADLDPAAVGAEQDDDAVPFLRFASDAQAAFDEWRGDLEMTVRTGTLPSALEAVLSKYRSLIPSLALLTHLADGGRGPVPLSSLDKAVGWGRYLFGHARRIYGAVGVEDEKEKLLRHIERIGRECTPREIVRGGLYATTELAELALNRLAAAGRGAWDVVPAGPKGGAPSLRFRLRPPLTPDKTPPNPRNTGFCHAHASAGENPADLDEINCELAIAAEESAAVADGEGEPW